VSQPQNIGQRGLTILFCSAKYPLAVVEELLDAFGMNLGMGYDVGCHFRATVANSSLGDKAQ
jgi:hypothetical protein